MILLRQFPSNRSLISQLGMSCVDKSQLEKSPWDRPMVSPWKYMYCIYIYNIYMYVCMYIYIYLVDSRQTVDSSEHTAHRIEMIMVIDYTTDEDVIRNKIFTILMTLLGLWLYCYTHWLVMPTTWLYLWTIALSWLPPVIVPRFTRPPHFHLKVRPSICVVKPAHLSFNPPICWWNNRKDCFKVPPFHSIHSIHWWQFFLLNSPISSMHSIPVSSTHMNCWFSDHRPLRWLQVAAASRVGWLQIHLYRPHREGWDEQREGTRFSVAQNWRFRCLRQLKHEDFYVKHFGSLLSFSMDFDWFHQQLNPRIII